MDLDLKSYHNRDNTESISFEVYFVIVCCVFPILQVVALSYASFDDSVQVILHAHIIL
jgi:hypothetical protein